MKRKLVSLCLLVVVAGSVFADAGLVGAWGANGELLYRFRKDGTGDTQGAPFRWQASKGVLSVTADGQTDRIGYTLQGETLTLMAGPFPVTLTRVSKSGSGARSGERQGAAKGKGAGGDSLSTLLLSSPWCSFSYNPVTGYSNTKRYQFFRDGTWSNRARTEGYSSGRAGSLASQRDGGGAGRWQVKNGRLYVAQGTGAADAVTVQVKQNSGGDPILVADGVEYSPCQ